MERLNPKHGHEAIVYWDGENGKIMVCLQEPLSDVVRATRVDYPLRDDFEGRRAVLGDRALALCQGILYDRTTVSSIFVTPHQIEIALAPLTNVDEVYDDIIEYVPICLHLGTGIDGIYDLRKRDAAEAEGRDLCLEIENMERYDLCGWSPGWSRVFLLGPKTSIYGKVIIGPAWRLRYWDWMRGVTINDPDFPHSNRGLRRKKYFATDQEKVRIEVEQAAVLEGYEAMKKAGVARMTELQAYIDAY